MTAPVAFAPRRRGRPPCCPPAVAIRIVLLHLQGLSYQEICNVLNTEGVPTPLGRSPWQRSYVDRVLHTRYARDILAVSQTL